MLKLNISLAALLLVAFFASPGSSSFAPATRMQKSVDSTDLDLTRKLIMSHFEKVDSHNGVKNGAVADAIFVMDLKVACAQAMTKRALVSSIVGTTNCAKVVASAPKIVLVSCAIDPIKSGIAKVNLINKSIRNRRGARLPGYTPALVKANVGNMFGSLTVKAIEKKSLEFVSIMSRVLTLGQLELCFD
jgi:hypothetical protein